MRAFRIDERNLGGGCREVRLEGELDLSVVERFQQRLNAAVADDVDVLVCLEECDFIDSTGIAVIVLAHRLMAGKGRRLVVCHPSTEVGRILAMTGLVEEGIVVDGSNAALAERFGHVVSRPFRAEASPREPFASNS
jgi:anti-sigma B factor antagonist